MAFISPEKQGVFDERSFIGDERFSGVDTAS